ncbi:MAG: efflux RND transporter permease subunit [Deltaproteobacteria bacterium]|nr:efflux RND transporter permease subunit [Deltaproteobacteria bacterium]
MIYLKYLQTYSRLFLFLSVILPVVCGVLAYQFLPKEGNPEITVPVSVVVTPFPGASPEEVEKLVTTKIEEELDKLDDVKEIRSSSSENISIVVIEFDVDSDIDRRIQDVKEAVFNAESEIPEEAEDSVVEKIDFSDIPLMIVSVTGDQHPLKLKRITEDIADELEKIPEVQDTIISGGLTREVQILVHPERLDEYHLTILDVYSAVLGSDVNLPAGNITVSQRKYLVRILTEVERVEQFRRVPVATWEGRVVFLDEVADIQDGYEEDRSFSRVDGRPAVSIAITKRPGANILETSSKVRHRLEQLEQDLAAGIKTFVTADQAKYVKQDFDLMTNNAVSGFILVIMVLYFAMGFRNALLTSLAIPLSLATSFFVMYLMGLSNNSMVRFSLVLCIGILVDNAIVVVENVYYHSQLGKDRVQAVVDGVSEIAMPVISSTLTTVAAFVPMLLMTGVVGAWMAFMPKTVSVALLSSLFVALVANPLILMRVLKGRSKGASKERHTPEKDLARTKRVYQPVLIWALNHRKTVVLACALLFFASLGLLGAKVIEVEMFPDADFDYIYIEIETPPGTDIEVTNLAVLEMESVIRRLAPEAVRVVSTVGSRGQSAYEVSVQTGNNSNYAEVTIELKDGKEYKRAKHRDIQRRLRPYMAALPGAEVKFRPLEWGPPRVAPVVVKIFGEELPTLIGITNQVVGTLETIRGAVEITDDFSDAPPELLVSVDRTKAAAKEVSLRDLSLTVRAAISGLETKKFRDEVDASKEYDVNVRFHESARQDLELLDRLRVRAANGSLVYLSSLTQASPSKGVNVIRHSNLNRVVRVTAQNMDRSAVEITNELRERLNELKLPTGYTIDYAGDIEETQESFASLKLAYIVAFLLIMTILVAQFNSFFQPIAIMISLPLSVVGAVVGLLVTGNNFSIMSFIGLVGLSGIVVNDAIVLVDCINRFRKQDMDIYEAVVEAGKQRLRPILSTTITTMGGLVTLTVTDELWEGLGVVIIFGIGFATLLTLVVVPVGYMILERFAADMSAAMSKPCPKSRPLHPVYYLSGSRHLKKELWIVAAVQCVVLLAGAAFWALPLVEAQLGQIIQAPTVFKWVLEALVSYVVFFLKLGGVAVLLLTPTWILLLRLYYLRSQDCQFIWPDSSGITIAGSADTLYFPWTEIRACRFRDRLEKVKIRAGRRLITFGPVVSEEGDRIEPSLAAWIRKPRAKRSKRKQDFQNLKKEILERMEYPTAKV